MILQIEQCFLSGTPQAFMETKQKSEDSRPPDKDKTTDCRQCISAHWCISY